jgi:hypothetical protein
MTIGHFKPVKAKTKLINTNIEKLKFQLIPFSKTVMDTYGLTIGDLLVAGMERN